MNELAARIARLKMAIGDLTWMGILLVNPEFTEVHSCPEVHLGEALAALPTDAIGEQERIMVVLSMQALPLPRFVDFAEHVLRYLEAGSLSQRVFEWAVFPSYDWSTTVVENIDDSRVRRLLRLVLDSPAVSTRCKQHVKDEILTGNAGKDVLELRGAGELA